VSNFNAAILGIVVAGVIAIVSSSARADSGTVGNSPPQASPAPSRPGAQPAHAAAASGDTSVGAVGHTGETATPPNQMATPAAPAVAPAAAGVVREHVPRERSGY